MTNSIVRQRERERERENSLNSLSVLLVAFDVVVGIAAVELPIINGVTICEEKRKERKKEQQRRRNQLSIEYEVF